MDIKPTDPNVVLPSEPRFEAIPIDPKELIGDQAPIQPYRPRADIIYPDPNVQRCEIAPGDPHGGVVDPDPKRMEVPPVVYVADIASPLVSETLPPGPYRSDIVPIDPHSPTKNHFNEVPPYPVQFKLSDVPPGPWLHSEIVPPDPKTDPWPPGGRCESIPPGPYRAA